MTTKGVFIRNVDVLYLYIQTVVLPLQKIVNFSLKDLRKVKTSLLEEKMQKPFTLLSLSERKQLDLIFSNSFGLFKILL